MRVNASSPSRRTSSSPGGSGRTWKKATEKAKAVKKLFRDLEKDGVTYSFLNEFMLCREQARLSYVEGYTRDGIVEALDYGTLFHKGMEVIAKKGATVKAAVMAIKREGDDIIRDRRLKQHEAAIVQELSTKARIVFPWYHEYWRQKKGHEFRSKFVAREESFRLEHEIPFYDGDGASTPRVVVIRGRFDAIFRLNGRLWLMENKTKSQIDEEGLQASLSQDLQTMLYCHTIKLKFGEAPVGVLYNVIRRPQLRQKKDETQSEFFRRIEDDVQTDPDRYFMRWEVSLADGDIEKWVERSLNPILTQVCLWWDEIKQNPFNPWKIPGRMHHFQNPEGLYTRYGKSQYFEMLTRNSTYGLRKRDK